MMTHGALLHVMAGLVPAIRRGTVPLPMAGTVAGHDELQQRVIITERLYRRTSSRQMVIRQ
jgi:hypothetical protein